MREINAILTIAYRDFVKMLRDRGRVIATFIFPFIFIGILGTSLQSNYGGVVPYNILLYVFTGVLGQTLFQSTTSGLISLIEDRENDFSQEIFVSPISRCSIVVGKLLGQSLVAMTQLIGILLFGFIMGIHLNLLQIIQLIPFFLIVSLFGGAFGLFVLSNLKSQRSANQIFPFVIFPQFFLAGVFSPNQVLDPIPLVLSRIMPMTYAVDLIRSVFYTGSEEYSKTVLFNTPIDLAVIFGFCAMFIILGTYLFVKNERNK